MIHSNREAVNPLRPYSVPGAYAAPSTASSAAPASVAPTPSPTPVITPHRPTVSAAAAAVSSSSPQNAAGRYASKARDMLQDLDYDGYLGGAGDDGSTGVAAAVRGVRAVTDDLMWKYTSVLMAQPFEMAKAVLQVRCAEEAVDAADAAAAAAAAGAVAAKADKEREHEAEHNPFVKKDRTRDIMGPDEGHGMGSIYDMGDSSQVWNAANEHSDSENDEISYFSNPTTPAPSSNRRSRPGRRRGSSPPGAALSRQQTASPQRPAAAAVAAAAKPNVHHLQLVQPGSILEVMNKLWQKEGPFGVWKGSNATFVYSVLQSLLENWSRSLLSALFNVPDLAVVAEVDRMVEIAAPYPWASLFVAATASVVTGLLLAPLDLVRTRLMLTPSSQPPRRTLTLLQSLPSYLCPPILFVPTVLHSLTHPLLTLSTPLIVRTQFMIDSQLSPMTFSIAKFFASSACLLVKLPLETVLRRGQVAVIKHQQLNQQLLQAKRPEPKPQARRLASRTPTSTSTPESEVQPFETVVPTGRYSGVFGTMYHIVWEEGTREVKSAAQPSPPPPPSKVGAAKNRRRPVTKAPETVQLKGQGFEGLWRGWKVSWWGLLGLWASSVVGNGGDGEF